MAQNISTEKYTSSSNLGSLSTHSFTPFPFLPPLTNYDGIKGFQNIPYPQWFFQRKLLMFQVTGCDSQGLGERLQQVM